MPIVCLVLFQCHQLSTLCPFVHSSAKKHSGSCDHTLIRRSQTSLLVPTETTPDKLGLHSTIRAEGYASYHGKSPRRIAAQNWGSVDLGIWFVLFLWLVEFNQTNQTDQTNKRNQTASREPGLYMNAVARRSRPKPAVMARTRGRRKRIGSPSRRPNEKSPAGREDRTT
jgi:hypothetical protein